MRRAKAEKDTFLLQMYIFFRPPGCIIEAVRTRKAASRRFVSMHGPFHFASGGPVSRVAAAVVALAAFRAAAGFPPYEPVAAAGGETFEPTGFFRAVSDGGRDFVVDPLGRAVTIAAIDHVRPMGWKDRDLGYDVYGRFVETNYPSKAEWLDETLGRLRDWGFNTLANHCDEPLLRHRGLAHTITLYLGGKFARAGGKDPDRWITPWSGPCTGIPNVFHPDFETEVRKAAAKLCAPERDNPWLLGWFLDNELKWWGPDTIRKDLTLFDVVRALPKTHSARQALEEFLAQSPRAAEADRVLQGAERVLQGAVGLSPRPQTARPFSAFSPSGISRCCAARSARRTPTT